MITITIFLNQKEIAGFRCSGHAGYAESGSDVVCAGVSALVINTINSIDQLTDSKFKVDTEEDSGLIDFSFQQTPGNDAKLLISSMILGLKGIQRDYSGNEYLILDFKEV